MRAVLYVGMRLSKGRGSISTRELKRRVHSATDARERGGRGGGGRGGEKEKV